MRYTPVTAFIRKKMLKKTLEKFLGRTTGVVQVSWDTPHQVLCPKMDLHCGMLSSQGSCQLATTTMQWAPEMSLVWRDFLWVKHALWRCWLKGTWPAPLVITSYFIIYCHNKVPCRFLLFSFCRHKLPALGIKQI